ncbi:3185_t:CDS:2, partial [Dentiscutata heterogama]
IGSKRPESGSFEPGLVQRDLNQRPETGSFELKLVQRDPNQ